MKVKGLIDEDFVNYKVPVMYIAFPCCSFKCDAENGVPLCQNGGLSCEPDIEISEDLVIKRYLSNPITEGIVISGLEPFDTPMQLFSFVDTFRLKYHRDDPIVIFTGYTEEELSTGHYYNDDYETNKINWELLTTYGVIVKFGRFRPNQERHYDEVLGVTLASDNQYAKEFPKI